MGMGKPKYNKLLIDKKINQLRSYCYKYLNDVAQQWTKKN